MNIVKSILDRHFDFTTLNIIVLGKEPDTFMSFLGKLNHKYYHYNDLYFASSHPNLLLCNNRIENYKLYKELVLLYHIPSISIDHTTKNSLLDNEKLKFIDDIPTCTKVATNIPISRSWNSIHDYILPYDINRVETLDSWNNLLIQTSKKVFKI